MSTPYGNYGSDPGQGATSSENTQPQANNPYQGTGYPQYSGQPGYQRQGYPAYGGADPRYGHVEPGLYGEGTPRPKVGFKQAMRNYGKYMFRFSGRASRSEFWWVQLFWALLYLAVVVIAICGLIISGINMTDAPGESPLGMTGAEAGFIGSFILLYIGIFVLSIAQFVTTLGLCWRRVQDAGMHGALSLLQLIGLPVMLAFGLIPSSPSGYQYDALDDRDRP